MAGPVPSKNPGVAHQLPPAENEWSKAVPDYSNGYTQSKPGSDGASASDSDHEVNEKAAPPNQPEQARKITGIKWALVVVSILSSTFLYALDNTVVADVQPKIVDRFGQIQKLPWLPISFLVACVATNLIWYVDGPYFGRESSPMTGISRGKIYGQFNAKWLYLACVFLFEVGSALCGAAPTMNALIGGRVLAGMGGAGLIFPCQFLKDKTLILLFIQMSASVTIFFVPIYFIPLFFQFARNDSAIEAGVRLLPLICLLIFAVTINGALMSKYGYYMPWYLVGGCLALIGSALMYTVELDTSTSNIYGYTVLLGLGSGMYGQAGFAIAQVKVRPHEIPSAIGFISLAQIGGATIALAIANSVFLNQATNDILAIMPNQPRSVVQGAVSGARSAFFRTLDPSVRIAVLEAVTRAISKIYILAMTAAALTVVLAMFMSREKVSDFQPTSFHLTALSTFSPVAEKSSLS
ncbi:MAG: hypothetical protein Q9208_005904 [Pyrenodesmia sp. 3 TL-2023]